MHLTKWKVRRSGARMVVYGTDLMGKPAKLTGVFQIEVIGNQIIAWTSKDEQHVLEPLG